MDPSVGDSGITRDKIKAAPMACDAAIRALLEDMLIKLVDDPFDRVDITVHAFTPAEGDPGLADL